jgi:hypothetical protein
MMGLGRDADPSYVVGTREHAARLAEGRHRGVHDALQWLAFSHLPESLQKFSRPFYVAAVELVMVIPSDSAELTTTLNKLVASKDWAVRAGIRDEHGRPGPVERPQTVVNPGIFEAGRG